MAACVPAVLLAAALAVAVPVHASRAGPRDIPDQPAAALDGPVAEPAAPPCAVTEAAAQGPLEPSGTAVSVASGQLPVRDTVNSMGSDWGTALTDGTGQLPVTEEATPDQDEAMAVQDDVALAASQMERPDPGAAAAVKADAVTEPEPVKVRPSTDIPAVKPDAVTEPAAEPAPDVQVAPEQPVETDPPAWLFGAPDPEPAPAQDPGDDQFPSWLLSTMDWAQWNNPYDGGPLCQKSWAQVPVPDGYGDTRAYVDLGMPVSGLTQADLVSFAAGTVRSCGADWFTVAGSDGYGIQFPGCGTDMAIYGPLDEYGEVTVIVRYLFLGEGGYYAVEP